MGTETVPRGPAPPTSSRASVAVIAEPHAPRGTNEKSRDTAGPTGPMVPYDCGPLGASTPPPGRRVATRLVVEPLPTLPSGKLMVTVSSVSGAPFAGWQDSEPVGRAVAAVIAGRPPWNGQQSGSWRVITSCTHPTIPRLPATAFSTRSL